MMSPLKNFFGVLGFVCATGILFTGCGDEEAQSEQPQQEMATRVKAIKVLSMDAPLTLSYSGQVVDRDEVKVQSKVSGNVVEKYVKGGQNVTEGQPLFKIDSRQYESAVLQAQANLAKSMTTLAKEKVDLQRDEELWQSQAISEQTLANQRSAVKAQESEVNAQQALLQKAQDDLADTVVYAPMSGRIGIDDVPVGTYSTAGNTALATIGLVDPVFVQFAVSEQEYLRFSRGAQRAIENGQAEPDWKISLTLADGSSYPYKGHFAEFDRTLGSETGTLTVRTIFENPKGLLVPGMYTRVEIAGLNIPNALLVPERALQQLLGETMVIVAQSDNKSAVRKISLGEKIGSYYVVKDGLKADDWVIVEGLTNLRDGMPLEVTQVTAKDMGFSFNPSEKIFDVEQNATK
ncbi:MAG: efflux RND transporter periplasmic adaptor subunit [Selenomonadaceae bacterium]|nr:efflux RND transporter periplasmic adaptor subunit [Selenomonadaceae bacterium]MBR4384679.1 efflux RND transporter periplasmic adaptor subunit [Selenomonadaceae bacterium]